MSDVQAALQVTRFVNKTRYSSFCYHEGMRFSFPKFIQACLRAKPLEAWDGLELTPSQREMVHLEFGYWKTQVLCTVGRHNLGTVLAFEQQLGWASTKSDKLRVLAELGANLNQPDASGRVASLEGIYNCTRPLTLDDLERATDLGLDVLAIEPGQRSILSIDMSMNYLYRDMVVCVQSLVERRIATLEAPERKAAMDAISTTPLRPEYMRFWSLLRASYFEQSLPDFVANPGASAPTVRF